MAATTGAAFGFSFKASVSLKLLVDPKSQKVVFAEAGKDFVDFLLDIVSLPLGTVTRILNTQGVLVCIGNLCNNIQNLGVNYIQPTTNKETLLKPMISVDAAAKRVPLLLSNMQMKQSPPPSTPIPYYRCEGIGDNVIRVKTLKIDYSYCRNYVANVSGSICPSCKRVMTQMASLVNPPQQASSSSNVVGYVKGAVTYMVMDNLVVMPMSTISIVNLLHKFNVKDVGVLEERVIRMGMAEEKSINHDYLSFI